MSNKFHHPVRPVNYESNANYLPNELSYNSEDDTLHILNEDGTDVTINAQSAKSAETADKDGSGNVIVDTYATKEQLNQHDTNIKQYINDVLVGGVW